MLALSSRQSALALEQPCVISLASETSFAPQPTLDLPPSFAPRTWLQRLHGAECRLYSHSPLIRIDDSGTFRHSSYVLRGLLTR